MIFKREIYKDLLSWKLRVDRKPLLVMGARQIGKTTLLKSFGEKEYEDFIYLNMEQQKDVHSFFEGNKDPTAVVKKLGLLYGKEIVADKTLIIIDEIQECRDALIALKYFQEELPEFQLICAGSLLGLSIGHNRSFPVGKVEFLDMYPLSFGEYLALADGKLFRAYNSFLSDDIQPILAAFLNPLQAIYKEYILYGGMPEVASAFLEHRNIEQAEKIQDQILRAYELDFVKHADKTTATKIQRIWSSIPSQLARPNKKFLFKTIRSGARAREYEEALQWLIQAGLVYKVSKVEKVGTPLKAYEDVSAFKIYLFETGLLLRLAGLDPKTFMDGNAFFTEFKGAIAENIVAQALTKTLGKPPYYWTSEGKAEVDFLIEVRGQAIPIEVESGATTKAKSLAEYKKRYQPPLRVRISNLNLQLTDDLLNIPLCYAEEVGSWIAKAKN